MERLTKNHRTVLDILRSANEREVRLTVDDIFEFTVMAYRAVCVNAVLALYRFGYVDCARIDGVNAYAITNRGLAA